MSSASLDPAPPKTAYRVFQIVYAILVLNFVIPAASYVIAPELALDTLDRVNRALGGGPYPFVESGQVWHMLGSGNVMTLGFMCALLLADLRRFFPVLPALAFLKGFSATYAAVIGVRHGAPAFLAIAALDGVTTVVMITTARAALRALGPRDGDGPGAPWWVRALLMYPARIEASLARARARGLPSPTLFQVLLGVVRMQARLVFRTDTVGTGGARPPRRTWRARLLATRALRLPFLVAERAVAPLDLSGLASPPDRVIRHLLAAHHDGFEFAYDLEILALHEGRLEELRDRLAALVARETPRSAWLRDLVVFEGYHEALLSAVERALAGEGASEEAARDPDLSLRAFLAWCAAQPTTLGEALAALRRGELYLGATAVDV